MIRMKGSPCGALALGGIVALAASCSGSDPKDGNRENNPKSPEETTGPGLDANGNYLPSRFEFSPGEPGRSVGIYATVDTPSGNLGTNAIEIELLEPPAGAATSPGNSVESPSEPAASGAMQTTEQALCSNDVGDTPDAFDTVGSRVCWVSMSIGANALGAGRSNAIAALYTREGRYLMSSASTTVSFPPGLSAGTSVGTGCVISPEGPTLSLDYLSGLQSFSISAGLGKAVPLVPQVFSYSVGYTLFLAKGGGMAKGIQYDTNLDAISFTLIPLPVSLSLQASGEMLQRPILKAKNPNGCAGNVNPDLFDTSRTKGDEPGDDALRIAGEAALEPLMKHLAATAGYGPGENMMAGSNADAFASLGGRGTAAAAAGAPPSSLDDFITKMATRFAQAEDNADIAAAGAIGAREFGNVLPTPNVLDGLLRRGAAGLELLWESAAREANPNPTQAEGLVRVSAPVGEELTLSYPAAEIASVLNVAESAVLGATVALSATHTVSSSEHTLESGELLLSFTPEATTPIVVTAVADLTNAAGPLTEEQRALRPGFALRLIEPQAGPAEAAYLSAAARVTAGGAVTLNVIVVDALGNPSAEPMDVTFFNEDDTPIGTVTTEHGVASIQHVPSATTPAVTEVDRSQLTLADDSTAPGIAITGSGFSVDAEVFVNGEALDRETVTYESQGGTEILVALDPEPGATIQVVNPGGAASEEVGLP